MFTGSASSLRLRERDFDCSAGVVQADHPRGAAYRTVFDVRLVGSSSRVYSDLDFLAAIRADDQCVHIGDTVTQRKIFVEQELVVIDVGHRFLL